MRSQGSRAREARWGPTRGSVAGSRCGWRDCLAALRLRYLSVAAGSLLRAGAQCTEPQLGARAAVGGAARVALPGATLDAHRGRLGTGREDALFALFLASNESDFFVGQAIPFSGGWVQ